MTNANLLVDKVLCCIQLPESQFVVILVVEDVEQVCKEWMDFLCFEKDY